MPRASAAAAALTAQQVLDAATALFAAEGFAAVSLDDVARAAGVTRGAVYHHYRSKPGLFRAVAARLQEQVAAAVVAAAEGEEQPAERLRAGFHAFLDAITAAPVVRILLIDAPSVIGWDEWRRLDAENSAVHLREALQDAGATEGLLDPLTAQLSGAMNEAALWIAQHEAPESARPQAHAALDRLIAAAIA
ncbi:TetR family transcriptional regulator [Microbacterium album]|uniref:TetR family transcriptional regulator n=1 Tax=Microbacterium album TaxID=2053191 RepID=A0A917IG67_9MICO|nr:TetR family transcriptional regulator [Microbacterium album]GGH45831.1 TetR family transcriptional regulator [Microbacterium album]